MSTGPNAGQVRGPVQITYGKSLDAVLPLDISITRMAVADKVKDGAAVEDYAAWEQEQPEEESREADEAMEAIRAGLAELFEDGWTTGELDAMTQDEGVKREIASGHGVVRAACGYLKRMLETAAARKGNVPIARTTAAGAVRPGSAIEQMSDREFAAFSKRAQEAMMAGKKVRME